MPPSVVKRREILTSYKSKLSPLIARIYAARGISDDAEVDLNLSNLISPYLMGGMDRAAQIMIDALDRNLSIIIAGDYDCDGATGTATGVRGFRMLGFNRVGFILPDRFKHGYGLSPALVAEIPDDVDVIVTVDSGVSSVEGVAAAKARGKVVVITDHHLPGDELPNADAIINPNLKDDPFPSKALAGVGVMFYLLLAIRSKLRARGDYNNKKEPNLSTLLDIVTIGTVADLVPLDRNNRTLVAAGLRRIREGGAHRCVYALLEAANKNARVVTATDISF